MKELNQELHAHEKVFKHEVIVLIMFPFEPKHDQNVLGMGNSKILVH